MSAEESASGNLVLKTPIAAIIDRGILGLEIGREERDLIVQNANPHTLHIKNDVSKEDTEHPDYSNVNYPSYLSFEIEVTDGENKTVNFR